MVGGWVALAAGGSGMFTTARGSESLRMRLSWRAAAAFGGHLINAKQRLRRASATGGSGRLGGAVAVLLVVAFVPDPSSLSSP